MPLGSLFQSLVVAAAREVSLMFILGFPLLLPKPITPCLAQYLGI